ncbi:MAG: PQQ-binding-like beta-propeller repeat protein [Thermoguttaceae bacterium]|jgi:outer membrane protein assembly factor BamB
MRRNIILVVLGTLLASLNAYYSLAADDNWPQFRGTGARGIAAGANLPDQWSDTENVAWKTDIPGLGWSSPIVWGNRVFLTTAVSAGKVEPPKKGFYIGSRGQDSEELEWKVICLDLASGKVLWDRTVHNGKPFGPIHQKNSYASETPATDGRCVYVYFSNVGMFCLDFEGNTLWSETIAPHPTRMNWGGAASPVLYKDRLYILNDNEEDSYILALDKRTGNEAWRTKRDEKSNWSTPYIWENEKRTEIITPGTGKTRSYDLDGKMLWWFTGMSGITIATPYSEGNLLFVSSGFTMDKKRPLYAIRPGAADDISLKDDETENSSVVWCNRTGAPYNPTTLLYDKVLYVLLDNGRLSALDPQTGKPFYDREKLPPGANFTSSPWACNDRVFCLNEDGVTFTVRAGEKFEVLQTNKLADDDMTLASPAISGDRLLIRTAARIYCIHKGN